MGVSELSATSETSTVADIASCSTSSPTALSSATALPQPSSVRRKSSLSRLPAPGTYLAGKIGVQTDRPGDGLLKSASQPTTAKLASAIACPAAVDKRKTVTAIRSLSVRNSATKSGPLKAMPSSVTPIELHRVDGMLKYP